MEKGIKGIYRLFAVLVIFFMIWAMASTIFFAKDRCDILFIQR